MIPAAAHSNASAQQPFCCTVRLVTILVCTCVLAEWFAAPGVARAQQELSGCKVYQVQSQTMTMVEENHAVLDGTRDVPVQIDCDEMQFFADHVESFEKEGRVTARGNVLFVSGNNRISAERMDFNTRTRTGTFYVASGTTTLREKAEPDLFGSQEPDAFFWGEELHKLGPKKYRITRGGFTTCVQPTPRWEITSGSVTLNLDDYALLTNALFRVKDVPVMYLPIFYYPIQEDDRATGFLMPAYGTSTVRGQSISNAFFWAINRSQDATIYHDWFSKTGQAVGGEYRYVLGPGSQGNARVYMLNEHQTSYQLSDGTTSTTPAGRSYQVTGDLAQRLPHGFYARGTVDYFSSVVTQQRYQQNIYQASNRTRRINGNISGNWNAYAVSATLDRTDTFFGDTSVTKNGTLPRISVNRGERPIGRGLYFGANTEFVHLQRSSEEDHVEVRNQGLSRVDVLPTLRIPFTRWPFFTVNSSVAWRATYWSESLDNGVQVPDPIGRSYFTIQSQMTGPVFNRIWSKPNGKFATKFKHVIEPALSIQRTTAIDNFSRIVQLDGSDFVIGGVTSVNYGLNNRLYAKKDTSREILSVGLTQSWYTNARASQYDRQYQSSFSGTAPTKFSPLALTVRATPTDRIHGDFRTEWDPKTQSIRSLAANGTVNAGPSLQASAGWSKAANTHYLNGMANIRRAGNRLGGTYSFNFDLRRNAFLQQRYVAYYNSQCCGVGVEYQTFNYSGSFASVGVRQDHRFNLSLTLGGIATFSNLLGAFGGAQGR